MNSKIYIIRSPSTDNVYIGSTTQRLSKRFAEHNSAYRRFIKGKGNGYSSFKLISLGDSYIELIETVECLCREELLKIEGGHIRNTQHCINKQIVGRTKAESVKAFYEANVDYNKIYYHVNMVAINAKQKVKHTCPCEGRYTSTNRNRHLNSDKHQLWEFLNTPQDKLTEWLQQLP